MWIPQQPVERPSIGIVVLPRGGLVAVVAAEGALSTSDEAVAGTLAFVSVAAPA